MGVPGHPAWCESAAPMISGTPQAPPLETTPTSPGLAVVWCIWNEALCLKSPWDKYVLFTCLFIFYQGLVDSTACNTLHSKCNGKMSMVAKNKQAKKYELSEILALLLKTLDWWWTFLIVTERN